MVIWRVAVTLCVIVLGSLTLKSGPPRIDGIGCVYDPERGYHQDVHISLFVRGQQLAVPLGIGMIAPRVVGYASGPYTGGAYAIDDDCVYQLHTHDNSGIVHVEPQTPHQTFTLAQFFDIWGQPLSSTGAAGYTGTVRVFRTHLDGGPSETREVRDDPRAVTINERPHDDIAVQVGPPWALLPRYAWYPRSPQSGAIVLAKGGTIGKWGAPTRGAGSRPSPRRRLVVMLLVIVLVGCAVEAFVALRRRRVRPRWA